VRFPLELSRQVFCFACSIWLCDRLGVDVFCFCVLVAAPRLTVAQLAKQSRSSLHPEQVMLGWLLGGETFPALSSLLGAALVPC